MENKMFCFQCEQTGCDGCTGSVGVCGKKSDTAKLQDKLTGALIGLARSADGNEHMINSNTYKLIIEGLFTTLTNVNFDDNAIQNQIELVHIEKSRLIPNCRGCASPCGKNDDYEMSELWNADENIRSLKSLILFGLRGMAAYAYHAMVLGYTDDEVNHFFIEGLPLSEHPADCSWGYQNTGFFSPTSRYGTAAQLMELVDKCHKNNIGVIMDFVPVHFAVDGYGLAQYDGSYLYEYPPSDVGISEWGTCNFNHSRNETRCLVQSAANFWLEKFHFDGLRMDAISRAIYWGGDPARGVNENTVSFLKNMNLGLQKLHPTAMLIAEDSTAFPKITAPVEYDGLGFDYKWDLGWMNDTLDYFRIAPWERHNHYHKLTFSMAYFYNELFILPFSHDETVHGKATIIQKMYGDYQDKFLQCRALYMYMYAHPGKKLNFMGNEFGQFREWSEEREQDWQILQYPLHDAFQKYITKLNEIYLKNPALHSGEYNMDNFRWIMSDNCEQCVYIFERSCGGSTVLCVFNFSGMKQEVSFTLGKTAKLKEILNSRWEEYGGDVPRGTKAVAPKKDIFTLTVTPLTGSLFEVI